MRTITLCAGAVLVAGCSVQHQPSPQPKPYVIGMGDIMLQNQLHHSKLWFAGSAGNWPLAQYEAKELHEACEDIATFHPTFGNRPTTPLVDEFITGPFGELDKAVDDKNTAEFAAAYGDLTNGCNGCHKELGYAFNVIVRPTTPPISDQEYTPAKPG